ncbi:hypothetical protein DVS77_10850 [Mycolicibacterium moriokaense]|nr:hypothetical protein DVS77_10850 [Mycolicibacterium moriokaense]
MRKIIAAPVIACGLVAATISVAGQASAYCDSAECVPNVARGVVAGAPCPPGRSYVFGLDSQQNTLICAAWGQWAPTGPLIGERDVALPCAQEGATAQEPLSGNDLQTRVPGIPLQCAKRGTSMRWVHFDVPAP